MQQISRLAPHFGPECRVWVFIGKRALDATETAWANEQLVAFTQTWQTHGKAMNASGFVFENQALVIVANEAGIQASGCSMDKINQQIRQMGTELGVDYFDRMNTMVKENEQWILSQFNPSESRYYISAATQLLGELMY
jgi:predicted amidohydrolase